MNHRELLENWFHRVWTLEDKAAIREMVTEDTTAKGLGARPMVTADEFEGFHQAILATIGEIRFEIDEFMEHDDRFAALVTVHAVPRGGGAPLAFSGSVFCRVSDDKFVHSVNNFDFVSMFESLELLPRDAMRRLLAGDSFS